MNWHRRFRHDLYSSIKNSHSFNEQLAKFAMYKSLGGTFEMLNDYAYRNDARYLIAMLYVQLNALTRFRQCARDAYAIANGDYSAEFLKCLTHVMSTCCPTCSDDYTFKFGVHHTRGSNVVELSFEILGEVPLTGQTKISMDRNVTDIVRDIGTYYAHFLDSWRMKSKEYAIVPISEDCSLAQQGYANYVSHTLRSFDEVMTNGVLESIAEYEDKKGV